MAVYEKVIRRDVVFLVADGANQANAFIRLDDSVGSSGPHRSCYHRCRGQLARGSGERGLS